MLCIILVACATLQVCFTPCLQVRHNCLSTTLPVGQALGLPVGCLPLTRIAVVVCRGYSPPPATIKRVFRDRIVLIPVPSFIPKMNTSFYRQQELILPEFHPSHFSEEESKLHLLDVRRALLIYLERDQSFRKVESFFVNFGLAKRGEKLVNSL